MSMLEHQNIEILARYLYEIEGCPEGRAKEHWLNAERQLTENLFRENRPAHTAAKADSRHN